MGIREQAREDAKRILGDPDGAGTPFVLISPFGGEYPVCGTYGDISLLIDPTNGSAIQGRTITASYPMALLKEQTDEKPEKKWKVKVNNLDGKELVLFVVNPPDHDFTIGITRLTLGADLKC